jgi:hypothetical protein
VDHQNSGQETLAERDTETENIMADMEKMMAMMEVMEEMVATETEETAEATEETAEATEETFEEVAVGNVTEEAVTEEMEKKMAKIDE